MPVSGICTLHISARLFERTWRKATGSSSSQKGMQQAQEGPFCQSALGFAEMLEYSANMQ